MTYYIEKVSNILEIDKKTTTMGDDYYEEEYDNGGYGDGDWYESGDYGGKYIDVEKLRYYYDKSARDGRITAHEVQKAVEHCGGGYISHHHSEKLLQSLAGWDGVVEEYEFVNGIIRYIEEFGDDW